VRIFDSSITTKTTTKWKLQSSTEQQTSEHLMEY